MKTIGLIFNPHAKQNSVGTNNSFSEMRAILGQNAIARITDDKDEISEVVSEFHGKGVNLMCISGGDGTISSVLTSYINLYGYNDLPLIVPLRGGTMNMISSDVGISINQTNVCRALVRSIRNNDQLRSLKRGTIKVIDPRFQHSYYSFTWIDGLLHKFIKWYYRDGAGVGVALQLILKTFVIALTNINHELFKQVDSTVYLNDKKLPFNDHLFIAAASVKRLVFGIKAFAEEIEPEGKFNFIYMRLPFFKKSLFKIPIGLYSSLKSDKTGNFVNKSTKSLRIGGNRGYVIDGEVLDSENPIDISLEMGPTINFISFNKK